jgi:hypothetical protein
MIAGRMNYWLCFRIVKDAPMNGLSAPCHREKPFPPPLTRISSAPREGCYNRFLISAGPDKWIP